MSEAGRINHLVNAMHQSGFYKSDDLKPGRCTENFLGAIRRLKDSTESGKKINRVVNAFRTIYPQYFRGVGKNCNSVTAAVKEGLEQIITGFTQQKLGVGPFSFINSETTSIGMDKKPISESFAQELGLTTPE